MTILKRYLNNMRDGYHHNSTYWQDRRKALPLMPQPLMDIAIAMVLSDAGLGRNGTDARMKIEQGYLQKDFVFHLFDLFKDYCFSTHPQSYIPKKGVRKGQVKSYWFKTFSHPSFSLIWDLFYVEGVKMIQQGLVRDHITVTTPDL